MPLSWANNEIKTNLVKMKPLVKIPDIIIILLALGLTFFLAYTSYIKPQGRTQVLIRGQGREWTFQMDTQESVVVSGPIGDTVVKIQGNHAWVESSPCENQTCVAAGAIARNGQWAACLPNNVLLIIQGTGDEDIDAITW